MKIPKYIDNALRRRTRYAERLDEVCRIVDDYILKNHLEDEIDTACFLTGCEIYVNPCSAEDAVRRAILAHEK